MSLAMAQPEKFLFDQSFDRGAPEQVGAARKPKAAAFTEDDIAAAEQRGFDAGHSAGLDEAGHSTEERIASCLANLAAQIGELKEQATQSQLQHERETLKLACHALSKMFPVLSRQGALAECQQVIESCLSQLRDEPRVVLRTADDLHDLLRDRIEDLGQRAGFEGRIVLLTDEQLGPSDVRVEWADGGAERDTAELWSEIEAIIARALDLQDQHGDPHPPGPEPEAATFQPAGSPAEALGDPRQAPGPAATESEPARDVQADHEPTGLAAPA